MKILVADDHAMFRQGLNLLLSKLFSGIEVVEAKDAAQARTRILENKDLDLALLDLMMPGMDGVAGLATLRATAPELPFAILSMSDSVSDIAAAIHAGARGYILKSSDDAVLKAAITLVTCGQVFVPPHAIGALERGANAASRLPRDQDRLARLTRRESEVLDLLMKGSSNKNIADSLGLLEGTVKKHIGAILRKLEVDNRTQAVITATQLGHQPPA